MLFAHSPRAFYCQRTGQVVALRQRMQGLARNVFLGDLTLEFDAVGAVLSHGFHPGSPASSGQFPTCNLSTVWGALHRWVNFGSLAVPFDCDCMVLPNFLSVIPPKSVQSYL